MMRFYETFWRVLIKDEIFASQDLDGRNKGCIVAIPSSPDVLNKIVVGNIVFIN